MALRKWVMLVVLFLPHPASAWVADLNDGYKVTVIPDVTVTSSATLVNAADAARATLNCTNNDASVNVRWGGSDVTATTGQQLKAGASIETRNTGAVYMISEGANVTVSCTKEVR